jgi:superoxide dismutase, Cu-Zn family
MYVYRFAALAAAAPLAALAACGGQARGPEGRPLEQPGATASLVDSAGARVGLATFSDSGGSSRVAVSVTGLTPGEHGMHIHETGACTPPDFKSAGNHFNPAAKKHGLLNPEGPHAGDLPNLLVEEDGSADTMLTLDRSLLTEASTSMLGTEQRSFVIHADPDDQKSDPSGNSGARVVCGVIQRG